MRELVAGLVLIAAVGGACGGGGESPAEQAAKAASKADSVSRSVSSSLVGSSAASANSVSDSASSSASSLERLPKPLEVVETGFTEHEGQIMWGVLVKNPNKLRTATDVKVSVAFFGANDVVLHTEDTSIRSLLPEQAQIMELAYPLDVSGLMRITAQINGQSWIEHEAGQAPDVPPPTFANVTLIDRPTFNGPAVTGIMTWNGPPLAGDGQGVVVGVLIRGEDGRLVAGSDARFESVTQGGVYPFEASFSVPLPPGVRIETYWTGPVTLAQSALESS